MTRLQAGQSENWDSIPVGRPFLFSPLHLDRLGIRNLYSVGPGGSFLGGKAVTVWLITKTGAVLSQEDSQGTEVLIPYLYGSYLRFPPSLEAAVQEFQSWFSSVLDRLSVLPTYAAVPKSRYCSCGSLSCEMNWFSSCYRSWFTNCTGPYCLICFDNNLIGFGIYWNLSFTDIFLPFFFLSLSVELFTFFVHTSSCPHLSVRLSIYLSICMSLCLSAYRL